MRFVTLAAMALLLIGDVAPARADFAHECEHAVDPDQRLSACTAAIKSGLWSGRDLSWAYANRGISYHDLEQYERAIEEYETALDLDPANKTAVSGRGASYANLGQYERAIEDYDKALRLDPGFAFAHLVRGIAYDNLGQYQRALDDYDRAIAMTPDDNRLYFRRGITFNNLGQHQRAIQDYGQSLRLNSKDTRIYRYRGDAYVGLGQPDQAVEDWKRAPDVEFAAYLRSWQQWMLEKGHYRGVAGGIYDAATRAAFLACATDPDC